MSTAPEVIRWPDAFRALRKSRRALMSYEAAIKLVILVAIGPLSAALVNAVISQSGDAAIGNTELIGFLSSGRGLVTILVGGALTLALASIEHAGLLIIALSSLLARPTRVRDAVVAMLGATPALTALATAQVVRGMLIVIPTAAIAGGVYWLLLRGSDINYYLTERPPKFIAAVAIGAVLALVAGVLLTRIFIRWLFAVPSCVLAGQSWPDALRASAELTQGRMRQIVGVAIAWQIAQFVALAAITFALAWASEIMLDQFAGARLPTLLIAVAFLLVVNSVALGMTTGLFTVSLVFALTVLYLQAAQQSGGRLGLNFARAQETEPSVAIAAGRRWALVCAGIMIVSLVGTTIHAGGLAKLFNKRQIVEVTAHRAGPPTEPENTLPALEEGIAAGAQWAEIDVQRTKDDVIVLVHDRDLRRLAGVARDVHDMTYEELRSARIRAAANREVTAPVPTLAEVIAAARGKIGLNIELKVYGNDPGLSAAVVELVKRLDFAKHAVITSLDHNSLRAVREVDRTIPIGLIVATSLGDLTRLDVDFLSVNQRRIDLRFMTRARSRRMRVYAWTVDDRESMLRLSSLGVGNLITDDPRKAVEVVAWYNGLTDAELVLLRFREWLKR